VNLEEDVQSGQATGLNRLQFEHNPLPEIDLADVDGRLTFLGRPLKSPILISSMTGGTPGARRINRTLAEAAQLHGVALGIGSQRAAIETPSLAETFQVRDLAPDILLLANLGAVQLNYGYDASHCRRAVEMIGADAFGLAPERAPGSPPTRGRYALRGSSQADRSGLPCARGPGHRQRSRLGNLGDAARRLVEAGVAAIDVAGAGGTSWSQVEMHRARDDHQRNLAAAFRAWGLPTADAVRQVREALPDIPLIGSGGLRDGLDIAKCIALGADLGGMAGPFLRSAAVSVEAVSDALRLATAEVRTAMFATGSRTLADLRRARLLPHP